MKNVTGSTTDGGDSDGVNVLVALAVVVLAIKILVMLKMPRIWVVLLFLLG